MNIYKLEQSENNDYDTYDSCIVCAENEDDAKEINPDIEWGRKYGAWCSDKKHVKVELIGIAKDGIEKGIILSSFNAG